VVLGYVKECDLVILLQDLHLCAPSNYVLAAKNGFVMVFPGDFWVAYLIFASPSRATTMCSLSPISSV